MSFKLALSEAAQFSIPSEAVAKALNLQAREAMVTDLRARAAKRAALASDLKLGALVFIGVAAFAGLLMAGGLI